MRIVDLDGLDDDPAPRFIDDGSQGFRDHVAPSADAAGLPILPRVDAGTLRDIAARRYDDFVSALEAMVNVDCGSYTPAGVNAIADMCEARFRANGWDVERRPHRPGDGDLSQLGDLVIGRLRGAGGPNVLMVGHMDTVFDEGTVAERPFRVDGDIAGSRCLGYEGRPADRVRRDRGAAGGGVRWLRHHHVRVQPRRGDRLAVLRSDHPRAGAAARCGVRARGCAGERRHRLRSQGHHGLPDHDHGPGGARRRRAREGPQRACSRRRTRSSRCRPQRPLARRHRERRRRPRWDADERRRRSGASSRWISALRSSRPSRRRRPRSSGSARRVVAGRDDRRGRERLAPADGEEGRRRAPGGDRRGGRRGAWVRAAGCGDRRRFRRQHHVRGRHADDRRTGSRGW